jgi:thymidine phosphorylase
VLDIKTGNGAFMISRKDSINLANSLIKTARAFDKEVIAFITDMNQPLGNYIGNWLEVYESVQVLLGKIKNDLYDLSIKLAGAMIYLGKKAKSIRDGEHIAKQKIENGEAFKKFLEIVELQGGDINYLINPDRYPKSKFVKKVRSLKNGYLKEINTYKVGMTSLELGAGRMTKEDRIDPKAGIILCKKIGDYTETSEVICELHSDYRTKIKSAEQLIIESIKLSNTKPTLLKLIKKVIQ